MTAVTTAEQVSPRVIKLNFDTQMRNNAALRDETNYDVSLGVTHATILDIVVPYAHNQPYVGPGNDGGAPEWVYIICEDNPVGIGNPVDVEVVEAGPVVSYTGVAVGLGSGKSSSATVADGTLPYWEQTGLRLEQAKSELGRLGKAKFTSAHPTNYGSLNLFGRLADLWSGGVLSTVVTEIGGPVESDSPEVVYFGSGGFSIPATPVPGIGDTITFGSKGIPCHIDKLWGPCDGSNTSFRSTIPFHAFSCIVIYVPPAGSTSQGRELELTEWFAPNNGMDQLVRLVSPPSSGSSLIAIYTPRQSLLRIDEEIIAYNLSDHTAGTAVIAGRAQLCSDMASHDANAVVEDFWATSMVGRAQYSLFAFGASGDALNHIALDSGSPRDDNPSVSDTELRRMLFNTAVTLRTNKATVEDAIRYVYPDLYPYILVGEDPRWLNCVTIFYSSEPLCDLSQITPVPPIELWETWLDAQAWPDGFPTDTLYDTYYRDPIGDVTYDGDYFAASVSDDPVLWPYPIVVSGPDIYLLGTPAPYLPEPYSVSDDYKKYIVRPPGLDRALAAGVGVLLLDIGLL